MKFTAIFTALLAVFLSSCSLLAPESDPISYSDIRGTVWYYQLRSGFLQTHVFYRDSVVVYDDMFSLTNQKTLYQEQEVTVWDSMEVYLQARNISNNIRSYGACDGSGQIIVDFCLSAQINNRYILDNCVWNQYALVELKQHSDPNVPDTLIWEACDDGGQMRFHREILVSIKPYELIYQPSMTFYGQDEQQITQ